MAADLRLSSLTPLWTVKQCKQTQLKLSTFCATLSIIVLSQVSHKHPPSSEGTDYVMQQLLTRELLHFSKENCSAQLSSGLLLCGNGGTKFGLYTVLVLFKTVMYASVESRCCAELKSSLPLFSPSNQNVYLL